MLSSQYFSHLQLGVMKQAARALSRSHAPLNRAPFILQGTSVRQVSDLAAVQIFAPNTVLHKASIHTTSLNQFKGLVNVNMSRSVHTTSTQQFYNTNTMNVSNNKSIQESIRHSIEKSSLYAPKPISFQQRLQMNTISKRCMSSTTNINQNKAALLTNYDTELAQRLRHTEKIIRPKPKTPGQRHLVRIDRSELWKGHPVRKLTKPKYSTGGRNSHGRITTRGRGGGVRRRLRIVDTKRTILDIPGVVQRLEYDPNRSAYLALIRYPDGRLQYIVAPQGLSPGDVVEASRKRALEVHPGNAMCLRHIPVGSTISMVELQIGHGAQLARAAGVACQLISKEASQRNNFGIIKLASGEIRLAHLDCFGVIGSVSNPLHHIRSFGKAGRTRWFNRRPVSRGLARNPVDHPHGGGGGAGRPGRPSISFSGVLAKGYRTRRDTKRAPFIHTSRHKAQAIADSQ